MEKIGFVMLCITLISSVTMACGSDAPNATNISSSDVEASADESKKALDNENTTESAVTDENRSSFADGWNLAREYMEELDSLESDPDCTEEYNAIIQKEKELVKKGTLEDTWIIADSLDDNTNETLDVSKRYYVTPEKEEILQAQEILKDYEDYYQSSSSPDGFTEYVIRKGYSSDIGELLPSKDGLSDIIAAEDLDDSAKFIRGGKHLLLGVPKATKEVLKKLKDRFQGKQTDEEISNEELLAISELVESGDFTAEDFGVPSCKMVTPKYILKQALTHVDKETMVKFAMEVGPIIAQVIKKAIIEKKLDLEVLQNFANENSELHQLAEQLIKGIISSVIEEAIKSGKLGEKFSNLTDEQIAEMTIIMFNVIVDAYQLMFTNMGKIEFVKAVIREIMPIILNHTGLSPDDGTSQLVLPIYLAGNIVAVLISKFNEESLNKQIDRQMKVIDVDGIEVIVPQDFGENGTEVEGYFAGIESSINNGSDNGVTVTDIENSSFTIKIAA